MVIKPKRISKARWGMNTRVKAQRVLDEKSEEKTPPTMPRDR
jgi:hypothetical protein